MRGMRWSVLAMVCAAFCLTGCSKENEPPNATGGKPAKLTFWHIMTYDPPGQILSDAAGRADAEVEVEAIKNDAFKSRLQTELAGGDPPDVFHTWGGGILQAQARAGKVLDLSDMLTGGDVTYNAGAMQFCKFDGAVYAVPLDISVVPLWYNKRLLREHGIAPPATFAELMAACKKLRAAGVTPLALGNAQQWPGAFYFAWLATRLGGADLFAKAAAGEDGVTFADKRFVEAGRKLKALVDVDAFSKGFNGLSTDQARAQFFGGKAAMYVMGTWLVAKCEGEAKAFMSNLGCVAFPTVKGGAGAPGTVLGGVNAGFAVSADCQSPEAAYGLLRELTSKQVALEWAKAGRLPAVEFDGDEAVAEALPAPSQDALKLLQAAPRIQLYFDQYLSPAVAAAHKETTQAIFAGTMTPQAAAEEMATAAAHEHR
jgi:raffinose/stachyose/melibiose transport system substrate-binding protein